jgi:hypothetical protein
MPHSHLLLAFSTTVSILPLVIAAVVKSRNRGVITVQTLLDGAVPEMSHSKWRHDKPCLAAIVAVVEAGESAARNTVNKMPGV